MLCTSIFEKFWTKFLCWTFWRQSFEPLEQPFWRMTVELWIYVFMFPEKKFWWRFSAAAPSLQVSQFSDSSSVGFRCPFVLTKLSFPAVFGHKEVSFCTLCVRSSWATLVAPVLYSIGQLTKNELFFQICWSQVDDWSFVNKLALRFALLRKTVALVSILFSATLQY